MDDMVAVGESIRISRKRCLEILGFVRENCEEILAERYR
jgi:hypothetical protein